jgi:hypothetical protein
LRKKIEGLVMVGRYWTKLYLKSKPWAEIRNENCLQEGCHDKRLLKGSVPFNKVVFDHDVHLEDLKRGKQLQCTSCHSQIVQGKHITVTESTCFICHFKKSEDYPQIADCSHCHSQKTLIDEASSRYNHQLVFDKGFTCNKCHSDTILGDGNVPRENCYKCHWERARLDQYDDTDLMHTRHISENKIECNQCHMEIQHKINKDIEAIADCKSCHIDFHKAQKILYAGEGGKGVSHTMPNVMLKKGLSCKGCHIFHEESGGRLIKSDTSVSREKACESCHGKGFSRLLKEWENSISEKLKQIRNIYYQTLRIISDSSHAQKKEAERLLKEALFNIEVTEKGKVVHNVAYSLELLYSGYEKMQKALQTIESRYQPPKFTIAREEIPTQCSNCHAGIDEINAEIYGLDFPHDVHLIDQKISCDKCHSNIRKHGEFIATKQSCAECHHKESEKECTDCHQVQKTLYQGGVFNGQMVPGDIMFEAGAGCTDCHLGEGGQVIRSGKSECLNCHEEEYAEIYEEWRSSVQDLMETMTSQLKQYKKSTDPNKANITDLEQLLRMIKLDGSLGIHNYLFIEKILIDSLKRLK